MNGPTEENYFGWLCTKALEHGRRPFGGLLRALHSTEFVWLVPGDKNRADEGMELRLAFMTEAHSHPDPSWETTGCSVLEMLVALAQRAEFQTDISARSWFWTFIENLGLDNYMFTSDSDLREVEERLFTFVWRTYEPDGQGGLFPMQGTQRDQREVELWFQFCEFVEEQQLA